MGGFTWYNSFYGYYIGLKVHGAIGKKYIYLTLHGRQLKYRYVVPHNPRSELQQRRRKLIRDAVYAWHSLTPQEKIYFRKNKPLRPSMTGFNYFVSLYIRSHQ